MKKGSVKREEAYCSIRGCDNQAQEDQWCLGCGAFICDEHDQVPVQTLLIEHEQEEHLEDSL